MFPRLKRFERPLLGLEDGVWWRQRPAERYSPWEHGARPSGTLFRGRASDLLLEALLSGEIGHTTGKVGVSSV